MQLKKRTYIIATVIFLYVLAATSMVIFMKSDNEIYAVIDGCKIYRDEMIFYLNSERAEAAQFYKDKYNADVQESDFWTNEYGGKTPAEYISDKALTALRNDRELFDYCYKAGITEKRITFKILSEDMKAENSRRKEAIKNNEPVYGITEYTLPVYMDYIKNNLIIAQKNRLKKEGLFSPDEFKLKKFYNDIKDSDDFFKEDDGSYKNYSEVRDKAAYLYNENEYENYKNKKLEKQSVKVGTEALYKLAADVGNTKTNY